MRTEGFLKAKHRFFGKTAMYVIPAERRLEIDEPVDFEIAEVLMRKQHVQKMIKILPDPIAAVAFDFDGVFTDNKVLVFQDGQEAVFCDRGDGLGLEQLKRLNIPMLVISKEENPVVVARCRKLKINCLHNISDKLSVLNTWLQKNNLNPSQVIYVGNDVNDIKYLQAVGCGVVVSDAHTMVKAYAKIILSSNGGSGAIRELCDLILEGSSEKNILNPVKGQCTTFSVKL
jgi:YrbI family 3-deoxy-D-manno-octulosonate 8-phosphate phosphatase